MHSAVRYPPGTLLHTEGRLFRPRLLRGERAGFAKVCRGLSWRGKSVPPEPLPLRLLRTPRCITSGGASFKSFLPATSALLAESGEQTRNQCVALLALSVVLEVSFSCRELHEVAPRVSEIRKLRASLRPGDCARRLHGRSHGEEDASDA